MKYKIVNGRPNLQTIPHSFSLKANVVVQHIYRILCPCFSYFLNLQMSIFFARDLIWSLSVVLTDEYEYIMRSVKHTGKLASPNYITISKSHPAILSFYRAKWKQLCCHYTARVHRLHYEANACPFCSLFHKEIKNDMLNVNIFKWSYGWFQLVNRKYVAKMCCNNLHRVATQNISNNCCKHQICPRNKIEWIHVAATLFLVLRYHLDVLQQFFGYETRWDIFMRVQCIMLH